MFIVWCGECVTFASRTSVAASACRHVRLMPQKSIDAGRCQSAGHRGRSCNE